MLPNPTQKSGTPGRKSEPHPQRGLSNPDALTPVRTDKDPAALRPAIDASNPVTHSGIYPQDPDHILNVIRTSGCSVRLLKVITLNSSHLPVHTVREYMNAREYARHEFLKLSGFGRIYLNELDQIMEDHDIADVLPDLEIEHACQTALQAIEMFCSDLQYPDDLLELNPTTRLANILKTERKQHGVSFFDFLKAYDETITRLSSRENCGLKCIAQFDRIVSRSIRARLSSCGADMSIEPHLLSLMRGRIPSRSMLARMAEIGHAQSGEFRIAGISLTETSCISDMIPAVMSTLDDRQQEILMRRYGIGQERSETLAEIGVLHDLTRERVRQIVNTARRKIATRRLIKLLVGALSRERILDKFFLNRRILTLDQIKTTEKNLHPEHRLAIDIVYGTPKTFLDAECMRTETGWVRKDDPLSTELATDTPSGTIRRRILDAIRKQHLPIRLSRISSAIPDYPESTLKTVLSEQVNASFNGDIITEIPNLPVSTRIILVIRAAGHAMTCSEIKTGIHEVFRKDVSVGYILTILNRLKETLIVKRGTYDLYENLDLARNDLTDIRNRTFRHLSAIGGFASVKVLFLHLFQDNPEQYGPAFGPYMLLGLLRGDDRFETKPGLMVGLASRSGESEFRSLGTEILAELSKSERPMTVAEIARALKDRRSLRPEALSIQIRRMPEIISFGRGRFGLAGSKAP